MSWHKHLLRRIVMLGVLATAGCGFEPVYGTGGTAAKLFGQVRAADPQSVEDFAFNSRIIDRLGPDGTTYMLDYALRIGVVPQAITPGEVTTRYSLNGTADFALKDTSGAVVTQGQVSNFTSYSTTGTTIATLSAETDARARLARMLADQVVTRLIATIPAP